MKNIRVVYFAQHQDNRSSGSIVDICRIGFAAPPNKLVTVGNRKQGTATALGFTTYKLGTPFTCPTSHVSLHVCVKSKSSSPHSILYHVSPSYTRWKYAFRKRESVWQARTATSPITAFQNKTDPMPFSLFLQKASPTLR